MKRGARRGRPSWWASSLGRGAPFRRRRGGEWGGAVTLAIAAYGLLVVAWCLVPGGSQESRTLISDLAFPPLSLAGAMAALAAAHHPSLDPATRRGWRRVGLGLVCWWLGDVLWLYYEVLRDVSPFPSLADAAYLGFYPFMVWGLQAFPIAAPGRDGALKAWLDSATVYIGGTMLVWYLVVGPIVTTRGSGLLETSLNLAYPVGDLMLILVMAKLLLRRPGRGLSVPLRVMLAGIAVSAVADLAYARLSLSDAYVGGNWVDALFATAQALLAISAVVQYRVAGEPVGSPVNATPGTTLLPYMAVLAGAIPVVGVALTASFVPVGGILLGSLCLAVVVMTRQAVVMRENQRLVAELNQLATTDSLTGLLNRRSFIERAGRTFARAAADGRRLAVLMIDIDHFKLINDRYGHAAGDTVLRAVAATCETSLRSADVLGRIGGDELIALLTDMDAADAVNAAERLGQAVRGTPVLTDQGPIVVTLSLGVADSAGLSDLNALLARADAALYEAKAAGRSCARAFVA